MQDFKKNDRIKKDFKVQFLHEASPQMWEDVLELVNSNDMWPKFLAENPDDPINKNMDEFENILSSGCVIATCNNVLAGLMVIGLASIPGELPEGYEALLLNIGQVLKGNLQPTHGAALLFCIDKQFQNNNVDEYLVSFSTNYMIGNKIDKFIVPIRPTLKCRYPLIDFKDYIIWEKTAGQPFDPFLRRIKNVFEKSYMAASGLENRLSVRCARKPAVYTGTVSQWQKWTGMRFLSSGLYTHPQALRPFEIDLERNSGSYKEETAWLVTL